MRMSNARCSFVSSRVCAVECAMCDNVCAVGLKLGESKSDLVAVKGKGIWDGEIDVAAD